MERSSCEKTENEMGKKNKQTHTELFRVYVKTYNNIDVPV